MCWRQRKLVARCCGDTKGLLPIPRARLGVALAKRGAVSGIGVGTPGGRGGTRWRGVSRTGLITPCGLGGWRQAVVSWLLRGLGCVVLRRKCSRRVLGGSLGSRRLWLARKPWGGARSTSSLRGRGGVILELLLRRRSLRNTRLRSITSWKRELKIIHLKIINVKAC